VASPLRLLYVHAYMRLRLGFGGRAVQTAEGFLEEMGRVLRDACGGCGG